MPTIREGRESAAEQKQPPRPVAATPVTPRFLPDAICANPFGQGVAQRGWHTRPLADYSCAVHPSSAAGTNSRKGPASPCGREIRWVPDSADPGRR